VLKGLILHYSPPSCNVTSNFKKTKVDIALNTGQLFISDKLEAKFDFIWKLLFFFLVLCYHLATLSNTCFGPFNFTLVEIIA